MPEKINWKEALSRRKVNFRHKYVWKKYILDKESHIQQDYFYTARYIQKNNINKIFLYPSLVLPIKFLSLKKLA